MLCIQSSYLDCDKFGLLPPWAIGNYKFNTHRIKPLSLIVLTSYSFSTYSLGDGDTKGRTGI